MITRINNNRGRRFLNPLEVEAQYHTEDRATNPDLLLWIDFTDRDSLRTTGGSDKPDSGDVIMIAQNKSFYAEGVNAGMTSAGEKALCQYVIQTDSNKRPVWTDPGDGTPPYATFDEGDFLMAAGSNGRSSSTNFST